MTQIAEILRGNAERIGAAAAAAADGEEMQEALTRLVADIARMAPADVPLDVAGLREAGADELLLPRLLRAVEAECVETLREACPKKTFGEAVLMLRARIQRSLPRKPIAPWCVHLAETLKRGSSEAASPEWRRAMAFFRSITSTIRDMVYAHDLDGNVFFLNDTGLKMVKYTREDMRHGMSIYDFVVQEHVDLLEARLESPGAVLRAPYSIEIYAKDGERIPIEIDTRPLHEEGGDVVGVVGVARDLRLERRLQAQIQHSNARLERLVSASPVAILTLDGEGVIRDANPVSASMLGVSEARALFGVPLNTLAEQEPNELESALDATRETGEEVHCSVRMMTRFACALHADVVVTPLHGPSGGVEGYLLLMLDITEQAILRQGLTRSEKLSALGRLMAGIAHEFNNPLTGILGYAQYLLNVVEERTVRERIERIVEESQRCRRLVQNMLSFAERGESEKSAQDINKLVKEILSLYEYQLQVDGIDVVTEFAAVLPPVKVAPQGIQRVFLNLLSNAHRALNAVGDQSPRVLTLRTFLQNEKVHVTVTDSGPGIPGDHHAKVFEPFFTTLSQGEGMGLGLSVAYGIVEDHGGHLLVESTEGKGATFTVALPTA